jgi:hypothetical protein
MRPLPTDRHQYVAKDGKPTREFYNWLQQFTIPVSGGGGGGGGTFPPTQQLVTAAGTTTLSSAGIAALINVAAAVTIVLPAPANVADVVWVKDLGGNAAAHPITIAPSAGTFIDGLSSFSIIINFGILRLYALSGLSGWYVG